MRSLLIALAAAIAAATVSLACGQEEEAVSPEATGTPASIQPSPTPIVKGQLWRWLNVTVVIPAGSDLYVVQTSYGPEVNPPDGGAVLELVKDVGGNTDLSSSLLIDADSGSVIRDNVRDEHRAEIEAILETLTVQPLDISTTSWPYNGEPPPDAQRDAFAGISFIRPSPETGLKVYTAINDPGGWGSVGIANGRSGAVVSIDPGTGKLTRDTEHVVSSDSDIFDRWLGAIKLCGKEVVC